MGDTTPIIKKFSTPEYKRVVIETSEDIRYETDLSLLSNVYCFPIDDCAWKKCSLDNYGLALIWASRFEVHVDQIIGLASKSTKISLVG